MASKCEERSSRKNSSAKAGMRKLPSKKGNHVTSPEDRARAMFLSRFGLKPYKKPIAWSTDSFFSSMEKDVTVQHPPIGKLYKMSA